MTTRMFQIAQTHIRLFVAQMQKENVSASDYETILRTVKAIADEHAMDLFNSHVSSTSDGTELFIDDYKNPDKLVSFVLAHLNPAVNS